MRPADKQLSPSATEFLQFVKRMLQDNKSNIKDFLTGPIGANMKEISLTSFTNLVSFSGFTRSPAKEIFSEFSSGNSIPTLNFISQYEKYTSQTSPKKTTTTTTTVNNSLQKQGRTYQNQKIVNLQPPKLIKSKQKKKQLSSNKDNKNLNIPPKATIVQKNNLPAPSKIKIAQDVKIDGDKYQYYRYKVVKPNEVQFCEELNELLKLPKQKKFIDKKNPLTNMGTYRYANDIFTGKYCITIGNSQQLKQRIQPKDIIPSQIDDNYFLNSLAIISIAYPEIINKKILFTVNPKNYYVVKLFVDGQWQYLVTDDQFPCNQKGNPIYAKPHGNQLWVMLLEKCWAKIFGSYKSIIGGNIIEGLIALTGAPCSIYQILKQEQKAEKYKTLKQALSKKNVVAASQSNQLKNLEPNKKKQIGLASGYHYSVLDTWEFNKQIVIKMKNPYGDLVWKGDWSFSSKKWTEPLRTKYSYINDPKDGTFFIGWDNFVKYFSTFIVCKVNLNHINTTLRLTKHKQKNSMNTTFLQIVISCSGEYNFSIFQQCSRKYPNKDFAYKQVRMILLKGKDDDSMEFIQSKQRANSYVTFGSFLKSGTYYLIVKIRAQNTPLVFSCFGESKVQVKQMRNNLVGPIKQDLPISFSKAFPGKSDEFLPEIYHQSYWSYTKGLGYIKIINKLKKSIKLELKMIKFVGFQIASQHKPPYIFDMLENTEQIIGLYVNDANHICEFKVLILQNIQKNYLQIPKPNDKKQKKPETNQQVEIQYFRLDQIKKEEIKFIQELRNLIQINKQYNDPNNPQPGDPKYTYKSTKDIFIVQPTIFQLAISSANRNRYTTLQKKIEPKDILQGIISDCYFLSALAAIVSTHPGLIDDKILFKENKYKYYVTMFFIDGQWQYITTDDKFPVSGGALLGARPHGNEIWVMLVEKCWAKVFGSYQKISGGFSDEAFNFLTGAPSQWIIFNNYSEKYIHKKIDSALQNSHVCSVNTGNQLNKLSKQQQEKIGLARIHSYTILKCFEHNNEIVLKMQNPWGEKVWNGDWSFTSGKWTQNLRIFHSYVKDPLDGTFYIGWKDFLRYFESMFICKITNNFVNSSLKLDPNLSGSLQKSYLTFSIKQAGTYYITVYQDHNRKHSNSYVYSPVALLLVKEEQKEFIFKPCRSLKNESSCKSFDSEIFQRGTYHLQITTKRKKNNYPIIVGIYGVSDVKMKQSNDEIFTKYRDKIMSSYIQVRKGQLCSINLPGFEQIIRQTGCQSAAGIGYIKMTNPTNNSFKFKTEFINYDGQPIQIMPPNKWPLIFDLKPSSSHLVYLELDPKFVSCDFWDTIIT